MSHKSKGIAAERELIHLFWKTGKFAAVRVAGSGAIKYPVPDIFAASQTKKFAIECKSTKGDMQYIEKKAVQELIQFANITQTQPIIAVRFDRTGWYFLTPEGLRDTGQNYVIRKNEVSFRSQTFDELTKTI